MTGGCVIEIFNLTETLLKSKSSTHSGDLLTGVHQLLQRIFDGDLILWKKDQQLAHSR